MIADILVGIGGIVISLINLYIWVIIISALLSFVNPDPFNPIVQFLYRVTNPAYDFVRRFMRTDFNGLDFAPLIIIIALQVVIIILQSILNHLLY
ncbi:Integral membrane protein YggT, involved in response to extracytoplasmic stress (osmotic shock) [hydrothermal vent metagenome]|uniref:Integral membrane protein YggT, involved in response to extracytoplasmic stress (Osmotic shock) n=1 Tax=hydrothermal vent metagenome TaxID=652676 RepID=A0A1W1B8L9_9ZZZZ